GSNQATISTAWGKAPASQSLIYAFDTNEGDRAVQDSGFNGVTDDEEAQMFPAFAGIADPAQDNYENFLAAQGNVLDGYKRYNRVRGYSAVRLLDNNGGSATLAVVGDVNGDNKMTTIGAYYEYAIDVRPNMPEGLGYDSNRIN